MKLPIQLNTTLNMSCQTIPFEFPLGCKYNYNNIIDLQYNENIFPIIYSSTNKELMNLINTKSHMIDIAGGTCYCNLQWNNSLYHHENQLFSIQHLLQIHIIYQSSWYHIFTIPRQLIYNQHINLYKAIEVESMNPLSLITNNKLTNIFNKNIHLELLYVKLQLNTRLIDLNNIYNIFYQCQFQLVNTLGLPLSLETTNNTNTNTNTNTKTNMNIYLFIIKVEYIGNQLIENVILIQCLYNTISSNIQMKYPSSIHIPLISSLSSNETSYSFYIPYDKCYPYLTCSMDTKQQGLLQSRIIDERLSFDENENENENDINTSYDTNDLFELSPSIDSISIRYYIRLVQEIEINNQIDITWTTCEILTYYSNQTNEKA